MAVWFWKRDCASRKEAVRQILSQNNVISKEDAVEKSDILTLPIEDAVRAGTECPLCWLSARYSSQ